MRNNSHCKSVNQTERYAKKLNQPKKKTNILSCAGNLAVRATKYKRSNIMQLGQNMGKVSWKTSIYSSAVKKKNSNKRQNHKLRPMWENKSLINHWRSEFGDDKHGVNTDNVRKLEVLENRCTFVSFAAVIRIITPRSSQAGKSVAWRP